MSRDDGNRALKWVPFQIFVALGGSSLFAYSAASCFRRARQPVFAKSANPLLRKSSVSELY